MPRRRVELDDALVHQLVKLHDGGLVAAAVAVVGGGEEGEDAVGVLPLVPFHDQLMRSHNELEGVLVVEGLRDVLPERVPGASRRNPPPVPIVGVAPHEVADWALVGDLDEAVQLLHVLDPVKGGGEAAVRAEDGVVDDGCERKEVEQISEVLPDVGGAVHAEAFVVKSVHLRDLPALMVPARESDPVRVPHFESDEEEDAVERVEASIHIVA
mmetsp:Transcript_7059/g.14052  ORF Transcript_7059/g.14052 Transcript_7059/m.14052 type:complete len:213 (-) Transcript_7059:360-998(-)